MAENVYQGKEKIPVYRCADGVEVEVSEWTFHWVKFIAPGVPVESDKPIYIEGDSPQCSD